MLVEEDYKGYYKRFALTRTEFERRLGLMSGLRVNRDTKLPLRGAITLKPMVHWWYRQTYLDSEAFNMFFTDMSLGLPQSDVESGNLAYIDFESMQDSTLYKYMCKKFKN